MQINLDSDIWKIIAAHLEKESDKAAKKTLQKDLSLDETQYWRGYYKALQDIKNLPESLKPKQTQEQVTY